MENDNVKIKIYKTTNLSTSDVDRFVLKSDFNSFTPLV